MLLIWVRKHFAGVGIFLLVSAFAPANYADWSTDWKARLCEINDQLYHLRIQKTKELVDSVPQWLKFPDGLVNAGPDEINERFLNIFESISLSQEEEAKLVLLWVSSMQPRLIARTEEIQADANIETDKSIAEDHLVRIQNTVMKLASGISNLAQSDARTIFESLPTILRYANDPRIETTLHFLAAKLIELGEAARLTNEYKAHAGDIENDFRHSALGILDAVGELQPWQFYQLVFSFKNFLGTQTLGYFLQNRINSHDSEFPILLAITRDLKDTELRKYVFQNVSEGLPSGQLLVSWIEAGFSDPDQRVRIGVAETAYRLRSFETNERKRQILLLKTSEIFRDAVDTHALKAEDFTAWTYSLSGLSPTNLEKETKEYLKYIKDPQKLPEAIRYFLMADDEFATAAYAEWMWSDQKTFDFWQGINAPEDAPQSLSLILRRQLGANTSNFNGLYFRGFLASLQKLKTKTFLTNERSIRAQGLLSLLGSNPPIEEEYQALAGQILKDFNDESWKVREAASQRALNAYPHYSLAKTKLAFALWSQARFARAKNAWSLEQQSRLDQVLSRMLVSNMEIMALTKELEKISLSER